MFLSFRQFGIRKDSHVFGIPETWMLFVGGDSDAKNRPWRFRLGSRRSRVIDVLFAAEAL